MKVIDLVKAVNVRQRNTLIVIVIDVDLQKQIDTSSVHENVLFDDYAYCLIQDYRKYKYIRDREVLHFTLAFNTMLIKVEREKIGK